MGSTCGWAPAALDVVGVRCWPSTACPTAGGQRHTTSGAWRRQPTHPPHGCHGHHRRRGPSSATTTATAISPQAAIAHARTACEHATAEAWRFCGGLCGLHFGGTVSSLLITLAGPCRQVPDVSTPPGQLLACCTMDTTSACARLLGCGTCMLTRTQSTWLTLHP